MGGNPEGATGPARLVLAGAERQIVQPADFAALQLVAEGLLRLVGVVERHRLS